MRLLAIANALDGVSRAEAARLAGMERQALRDALYATSNFPGLTGSLTCTPTGDCADPKIAVYESHAGQFPPERIWP